MVPLAAEILTDEVIIDGRIAVRRSLSLGVRAQTSDQVSTALILDISENGLMLETAVPLAVGEVLKLDIPEAGTPTVRVIWRVQLRAGCEFVGDISRAALSAALLASPGAAVSAQRGKPARNPDHPATYDGPSEEASIQAVLIILCSVTFLALLIFFAAVLPIL